MPYILEIFTRRARPTAASHAAKTRMTIGVENEIIELELRIRTEIIINKDSIMPSIHKRVDIKWDRNIRVPKRASEKAKVKLSKVGATLVIMISS